MAVYCCGKGMPEMSCEFHCAILLRVDASCSDHGYFLTSQIYFHRLTVYYIVQAICRCSYTWIELGKEVESISCVSNKNPMPVSRLGLDVRSLQARQWKTAMEDNPYGLFEWQSA